MSQISAPWQSQNLFSLAKRTYFSDKQTSQLYSLLSNISNSLADPIQIEAVKKSKLSSTNHNRIANQSQIQRIKKEAYAIKGVTLRQNLNNTNFNRNRTYSIVKASQQRKKTMTAQDFQKITTQNVQKKQIVYHYDVPEESLQNQSKYKQSKLFKDGQHSSISTIQNTCDNLHPYEKYPNNKVKPYKFAKLKKDMKICNKYIESYNIFNLLDTCCNSQGYETVRRKCQQKIQLVSKPIKNRKQHKRYV